MIVNILPTISALEPEQQSEVVQLQNSGMLGVLSAASLAAAGLIVGSHNADTVKDLLTEAAPVVTVGALRVVERFHTLGVVDRSLDRQYQAAHELSQKRKDGSSFFSRRFHYYSQLRADYPLGIYKAPLRSATEHVATVAASGASAFTTGLATAYAIENPDPGLAFVAAASAAITGWLGKRNLYWFARRFSDNVSDMAAVNELPALEADLRLDEEQQRAAYRAKYSQLPPFTA